jgi:ATP-dependent exoDNAse (exonuclease V) alpha subunit
MVERSGPRNKFWGCSTFPKCRYTKQIDEEPSTFPTSDATPVSFSTNDEEFFEELQGITLGEEQRAIYEILNRSNDNIFVTGKAGTGKSVLLKYFVSNTPKKVIVLAPTGVAAMRVGGETIHSRFAFDYDFLDPDKVNVIDHATKSILKKLDALVIDEISMVRIDVMESISKKFQLAKENKLPFGGVQIIVFGDLYQLPPIIANGEIKRCLDDKFNNEGEFFFCAPSVKNRRLKILELEYIYRQEDVEFQEMLNEVRIGQISEGTLAKFNERCGIPVISDTTLTIATKNARVDEINGQRLNALQGEEFCYKSTYTGDFNQLSNAVQKELRLKVGAQVVLLRNDRLKQRRWVNGTIAKVAKLSENAIKVEVRGVEHDIFPVKWTTYRYHYDEKTKSIRKGVVAELMQYPLRLAWALTIHKSQGQTYDSVNVDLGDGAFVHGQAYVAFSRCECRKRLYLENPLKQSDILVDNKVVDFINENKISIFTMLLQTLK